MPEDEIQKLPSEVRGGVDIVWFDLYVVQILEPENVAFTGFRDDAAEEEPQFFERVPGVACGRMREWQVYVDTVYAVEA